MSEEDFQRRVMDTAKRHGWMCVHYRKAMTASGRVITPVQGDKGGQDLILARAGVVILAELKRDKNADVKPGQREWQAAGGAHSRWWRPSDWDAILAELSAPLPDGTPSPDPQAPDTSGCACPFCPPSTP